MKRASHKCTLPHRGSITIEYVLLMPILLMLLMGFLYPLQWHHRYLSVLKQSYIAAREQGDFEYQKEYSLGEGYGTVLVEWNLAEFSEEDYVLTRYGEVVHLQSDCTILFRDTVPIQYEDRDKKLRACPYCNPSSYGEVYVTNYGNAYHALATCISLRKEFSILPKEWLGEYPICKICSHDMTE